LKIFNIKGAVLPIRSYVYKTESGPLHVFQCRWEAGAGAQDYVENEGARFNLIRAIWAGRGNSGQKSFEFFVSGYSDARKAEAALVRQLEKLLVVEKPRSGGTPIRK
jgi:hypothetical protein